MRPPRRPIHAVSTWVRRQPPKVKAFLAVVAGMAALVLLRAIVNDHDNLFVAAEAVHSIGISVLIYKLMKEKTCAGLSLKTQELTAMFLAVRLYCSFVMEYDIHTLLDLATLGTTLWVIYMIRFKLRSSYMEDKDNFGSSLQFLNYPFGDTTYTKVFVGGLAWETKSETLHNYFEQFGEILEAVVITDKHTGRSKGYGFVTFSDPEAAKRACADPSPVIDGRKANCNLASFGWPQPSLPYGRMRTAVPYLGSPQTLGGTYAGSPGFHQPVSYGYQAGFPYPPYGYSAYGPEYMYPQGFYNSYLGQHQIQMYSVPGAVNTNAFSYGQLGHPGNLGYRPIQGYVMPSPHLMQYGRPNVSGAASETIPTIQAPYLTGMAPSLGQARNITPVHLPQFPQSSGSD